MNIDNVYILHTFAPEIALVALALLVLLVDLLLPKGNKRQVLAVFAALGCLGVAGLGAWQWTNGAPTPPAAVQASVHVLAQRGAVALEAMLFHTSVTQPTSTAPVLTPDFLVGMMQDKMWPLKSVTETDIRALYKAANLTGMDSLNTTDARAALIAYTALRRDIVRLPAQKLGLAHADEAVWWLFANDQFSAAFKVIFALAAFLVLLFSVRFPVERYRGEFISLLLFAAFGLMVMVNSLDLVVLFLGLELTALCVYPLVAWHKDNPRSAEAGTKYLLLGSLASACYIYGVSLLFVTFGSTHLNTIAADMHAANPMALAGLLLIIIGFGFKVAGAPLHLWAPDVYQGAPYAVAAFLSTASKAAGFAVLLRVLTIGFPHFSEQWATLLGVIAALSVVVGNTIAVHQNNVKRLLAYSGIAQAGYLLIAVMATGAAHLAGHDPIDGGKALVLYLFLYTVGNIGAFAVAGIVAQDTGSEEMSAFAGLRTRAPLLAFGMLILLLSLGGIPLLAGFVGKWFIFLSGVQEGQYLLVLLGASMSVVSIYYYLLLAKQMYILPAKADAKALRIGLPAGIGLLLVVLLTVAIGAYPRPFVEAAQVTAQALLGR